MDKKKFKALEKAINRLKKRIIHHRIKCICWGKGNKPCYNCHYNTLTDIEEALEDIRFE